jgi:Ribosomal protein L11 methylase
LSEEPSGSKDTPGSPSHSHYWTLQCQVESGWEELWEWYCFEHGALGTEQRSATEGFQSFAYFPEHPSSTLKSLHQQFNASIAGNLEAVWILALNFREEEDWQSNWKPFFKPIQIGKTLEVLPPWLSSTEISRKNRILIDPGQGFGTGHHTSTALALELLEQCLANCLVKPHWMLDFGSGSGILSIGACLMGCEKCIALELEGDALKDVISNSELNQLQHRIIPLRANKNCFHKTFPLVISNMLLSELKQSSRDLVSSVAEEGRLMLSGILEDQVSELERIFKNKGFVPSKKITRDGWSALELSR